MQEITSIIGTNLKNIRKTRQLTLENLSKLTGVSISMLGELERGITNPTVTILWKIADGLKISFSDLIKVDSPPVSLVYHKDAKISFDGEGFKIFSLFHFDPHKKTEILYKVLEPGAFLESEGHRVGVEEYVLICDGNMLLRVGEDQYTLSKGDAIKFNGHVKHSYRNTGNNTVSAYTILYYPSD